MNRKSLRPLKPLRRFACLTWRRIAGPRPPNISDEQRAAIEQWAKGTLQVSAVRLFGSRALGCASSNSDLDLALTVGGTDPHRALGNYLAEDENWENQLSRVTGLKVHVGMYNDPGPDTVWRSCEECSIKLFEREGEPFTGIKRPRPRP
jgi:predicted nucleotidyltransferase